MSRALDSLKNFDFNGLLLSKVYFVWAKKVQRSYLSWNWRGIQNLERNRLVVSKLHKEFDKIWPEHSQVSKIFILMGSFWEKYILFELKKVQRNNPSWHWRVIQNLKKNNLLFGNWLNWRILEIFTRKVESVKIGTFIRSFCPKQKMYEL